MLEQLEKEARYVVKNLRAPVDKWRRSLSRVVQAAINKGRKNLQSEVKDKSFLVALRSSL